MSSLMHAVYVAIGKAFNYVLLMYWVARDRLSPPNTDAVLFVAHPDDDTLFFHTFIKQYKPYVCLMTTGWSLKRIPDFIKCMHQYGVHYRVYPLDARDRRMSLLIKHVKSVMAIKPFTIIATHNAEGEYGHEEHKRVHQAVTSECSSMNCIILCPNSKHEIQQYPLDQNIIDEKISIFKNIYTTETWVLTEEEAGTPVWVSHEHLVKVDNKIGNK